MAEETAVPVKAIREGLSSVGLKLSAAELKELQDGKIVSLESKPLADFGRLLVAAEALYKEENPKQAFTFANAGTSLTSRARSAKCRGTKVVKLRERCGIYAHWPPGLSLCCKFRGIAE